MTDEQADIVLTEDECWEFLAGERLGRVAVETGHGPHIFPVNHLVHERTINFRTAPGTKVSDVVTHPQVAFEVDGRTGGAYWSVVVEGTSSVRTADDPSLGGTLQGLVSQYPPPKQLVVTIVPDRISGRRFEPDHPASLWNV